MNKSLKLKLKKQILIGRTIGKLVKATIKDVNDNDGHVQFNAKTKEIIDLNK